MAKIHLSTTSAILSLLSLIGGGTLMFRILENWTWAESFYFSVATLTTVGYGDIHPTSDGSRVATAIFILLGVGVVFAALSKIGSEYLTAQEHRISENVVRRLPLHHNQEKDSQE